MNALVLLLFLLAACSITPERLDQGKRIAFERNKGNCLACHAIADGDSPGTIGPALNAIANRFQDKQQLRALIFDARQFNPETSMPPFGKNRILSDTELDQLVDYLWSLP